MSVSDEGINTISIHYYKNGLHKNESRNEE